MFARLLLLLHAATRAVVIVAPSVWGPPRRVGGGFDSKGTPAACVAATRADGRRYPSEARKKRGGRDTLVGEKKTECRARFTTPGKRQMTLAQLRSARESRETSRRREGGVAIKELRVARWSLVVSAIGGVRETVKA